MAEANNKPPIPISEFDRFKPVEDPVDWMLDCHPQTYGEFLRLRELLFLMQEERSSKQAQIKDLELRTEFVDKKIIALIAQQQELVERITELEEEPFVDRSIQPATTAPSWLDRSRTNVAAIALVTAFTALTIGTLQPQSSETMVRVGWISAIVAGGAAMGRSNSSTN